MMDALDEICVQCRDRKARVVIDAESQHFQRGIARVGLELMRRYNKDGYALVYNTYQAYLKGTPAALARHLAAAVDEGFTLGLKVVRGAYLASDERSLIHDTKRQTDDAYDSIAQGALRQEIGEFGAKGGRPFPAVNLLVAGHNKASVLAAHELHQQRVSVGLPTVPVTFAQLHGMSDELSFGLLALKKGPDAAPEVYKCSTWGSMGECLAYLMRRAAENRDAASRTADEHAALKAEMGRRLKVLFSPSLWFGNLGTAILTNLVNVPSSGTETLPFTKFIACSSQNLVISRGDNIKAVQDSDVVILGADPADIEKVLTQPGIRDALTNKLLISVVAGWTRQKLESTVYGSETTAGNQEGRAWVVRTLPNIAALVSQSLTAIEVSEPALPDRHLHLTDSIFQRIGRTVHIAPKLMNATTALAGSTPAFFAVIVDALIDAGVAVGVPRDMAHTMIFQAMQGTATMLQSGVHPALLKDQGTSPEGCTIGGLMVMEEAGVRGHIGRALREAVTVARLMENVPHVNDTRQ
ncbi:putative pyrroline-5-carboxylate reductase protein [Neofusicoccum parvum UCRNP2]|uniref:Proline dehydrogenase n=1 Tax=Botryosphaeria parva (strain UCR-NP2) TaxID=1287680 RepID=R1E858_BOTPV|nr:putative pyrroline-5-carboxylate reductase protein [Neofusicoccum parvum UCRNP2]